MDKEDANKIIDLLVDLKILHGEIRAYNKSLEKIDSTRKLFTDLFKEDEEKGVFAGLTVVENKIITECQKVVKDAKEIEKQIQILNGSYKENNVTSFEEWKVLNL